MNTETPPSANPKPLRWRWLLIVVTLAIVAAGLQRYRISRPEYRFARGKLAIAAQDWPIAEAYVRALEGAGQDDRAALLQAELAERQGQPKQAISYLKRIPESSPFWTDALTLNGQCLIDMQQARDAHAIFEFVIAKDPKHLEARRHLAALTYDLGHISAALVHLKILTELDDTDGKPYRLIGVIGMDTDNFAESIRAFRDALSRTLPDAARQDVHRDLVECLLRTRQYEDALQAHTDGTTAGVKPSPDWQASRAETLYGLGRSAEAREWLDPILRDNPDTTSAMVLRGRIHLDAGESAAAVVLLEKARDKLPHDHPIGFLLSQAYAANGRKADADMAAKRATDAQKSLELISALTTEAVSKPWDANVRLRLAEASDKMGKPLLAEMWRKSAAAVTAK